MNFKNLKFYKSFHNISNNMKANLTFGFFSYLPNNYINKIIPNYDDIDSDSDYFINELEQNKQNQIKHLNFEEIIPAIFNEDYKDKEDEKANESLYINEKSNSQTREKKIFLGINDKDSIQIKMKNNIYLKKPFKEKKLIGRKKKSNEGLGEHNKFSDDNVIRRIKNIVLDNVSVFINQKILSVYSGDDSNSLKDKQLFKLGQNQAERSKAEYNKLFLNATLQSIFSEDISTKYKKYDIKHNKILIEQLLNEENEEIRLIFKNIFNLTFIDCLKHFRGSIIIKELSEMKTFNEYLEKTNFGNNSEEYKEILTIFMNNFEKIIREKHSRKRSKKDKKQ